MNSMRPRAEALAAMSVVGGGEGFPRRFFCTSCNRLHVYFLSNFGSGRAVIIHSFACPGRARRCDPKPAPSAGSRGERR